MAGQNTYDKFDDLRRFSYTNAGFTTGNPAIDMGMALMLGQNIASRPAPGTNQSIMDAYMMRERNQQFMQARNIAFSNNLFFQKMGGVNPNSPWLQAVSMFTSDPDGAIMKAASPFMGGNPIRAQMGLFANLTGQTMGAFGNMNNITVPQTTEMMNQLYNTVYTQKPIRPEDLHASLQDVRSQSQKLLNPQQLSLYNNAFKDRTSFNNFTNAAGAASGVANLMTNETDSTKMKEAAEALIKTVTDPESRRKLSDHFETALKEGKDGAKKFQELTGVDSKMINAIQMGNQHFNLTDQKTRMAGFNFGASRGFALEDITEGFTRAADIRLVGRRNVNDSFKGFLANAPKVMDAARGIFGNNKSGGELMDEIDNMLGSSFVDLTDPKSAQNMEKMLRDVKSAARNAGISIEAIKGIIEQGKQLAQSHPELQQMGGLDMTRMAIRSTHAATALGSFYGGEFMRRAGGTVGLTQQLMAGELINRTEPISRDLAAMTEFFHQKGNQGAVNRIAAYAADGNADHTRQGLNSFINSMAQQNNIKPGFLQAAVATSGESMIESGFRRSPNLQNVADSSFEQEFMRNAAMRMTPDNFAKFNRALKGSGEFANRNMSPGDLISMAHSMGMLTETPFMEEGLRNGKMLKMHINNNPELKRNMHMMGVKTDIDTQLETQMSKDLSFLSSPVTTAVFNQLLNGEVDRGGISKLLDPLLHRNNKKDIKATTDAMIELNLSNKGNLGDYYSRRGIKISNADLTSLMDSGLTSEEIRNFAGEDGDLKFQKALSMDPGNKALRNLVNGLGFKGNVAGYVKTLNQIDPSNKLKGGLSFQNITRTETQNLIDRFKGQAAGDTVEGFKKSFTDWAGQGDMAGIYAFASGMAHDAKGKFDLDKFEEVANTEKFKSAAKASGISQRSLESFVQQAHSTKEKIDKAKSIGEKQAANEESGQTLKKILDMLGGSGGESIVDVLAKLNQAIREAMKTQ